MLSQVYIKLRLFRGSTQKAYAVCDIFLFGLIDSQSNLFPCFSALKESPPRRPPETEVPGREIFCVLTPCVSDAKYICFRVSRMPNTSVLEFWKDQFGYAHSFLVNSYPSHRNSQLSVYFYTKI